MSACLVVDECVQNKIHFTLTHINNVYRVFFFVGLFLTINIDDCTVFGYTINEFEFKVNK